jgi:hypothetical protein
MNSLGRTPKITRSALLPSVCQNHVATGVLLVLGANTTSNLNTHAPMTAETTRKPAVQRGPVRPGMGAVSHWTASTRQPRIPLKHLFRAPKRTTASPTKISGQRYASYQKILAKTKTSPRGLGAVRPATRGGLTSCTQQRTPSKNSYQTTRERPEISPRRSSDQGEQSHRGKSSEIELRPRRPRAVRPPPPCG